MTVNPPLWFSRRRHALVGRVACDRDRGGARRGKAHDESRQNPQQAVTDLLRRLPVGLRPGRGHAELRPAGSGWR